MTRKDAQKSQILQHLKRHGTITSMEAITLFGCTRLSGRIFDLRHECYLIRSDKTEGKSRNGNACQFTAYVYEGRWTEDGHLEPATWCDNRRGVWLWEFAKQLARVIASMIGTHRTRKLRERKEEARKAKSDKMSRKELFLRNEREITR